MVVSVRMQARRRMQNRTVQSLASSELACPPRVTPVVMQLQSEEGRNISLKCKVTGKITTTFVILIQYCLTRGLFLIIQFDLNYYTL